MLTQARLKELLHYDLDTGIFTRLVTVKVNAKAGDVAGNINGRGYLSCKIDGCRYQMHRLSFLYVEGYSPEHGVDHKNGDKTDNRWENLRHVTQSCNMQNKKMSSNNKSGFNGVNWYKKYGCWVAKGTVNKNKNHLGYYTNSLEAALARLTWEIHCDKWKCNYRGELVQAIKKAWPEFNDKCLIDFSG